MDTDNIKNTYPEKELTEKIIGVFNQEVSDLADINRAVIVKTEKIDNHEKRIIRVETKLGIKTA